MKHGRQKAEPAPVPPSRSDRPQIPIQLAFGIIVLALLAGWILYSPSFQGPFVFDDSALPFHRTIREEPLSVWLSGVRPALMFTYWLNRRLWGDGRTSYHAVNFLIHVMNTGLVFLVLWRLLGLANWKQRAQARAAVIGALFFLIHPLQTESVSYVAGRSESLSTMFLLLAYVTFLYRRAQAISWRAAIAVLTLFAIGVTTKENAISLAGILILTDVFWPVPFSTAGLRKNWRLYALMAPGGVLAAISVFRMLATAPSAGFSIRDFTWYQYGFTEARAIFTYIRFAVAPVGMSVDHDYSPSLTIFEHGAIVWMLLLGALIWAAIRLRGKYPLACFGFLLFLIALAPTSSVVPISDALVERRMYFPITGLILIGCELTRHIKLSAPAAWGMLLTAGVVLGGSCYARNQSWARPEELLAEAAQQSKHNVRPYLNLTEMLVRENRCELAIPHLERADRLFPRRYEVELAWGWALECLGRREEALLRLNTAAEIRPGSIIYEQIGLLDGEMNRSAAAGAALQMAVSLDPNSVSAHKSLALWYESTGELGRAEEEYTTSRSLDRNDLEARVGLARVRNVRGTNLPQ